MTRLVLGKIMAPKLVPSPNAMEHDAQVSARDEGLENAILFMLRVKLGPPPEGWRYALMTPQHDGIAAAYKELVSNIWAMEYLGDIYIKDDGTVVLEKP